MCICRLFGIQSCRISQVSSTLSPQRGLALCPAPPAPETLLTWRDMCYMPYKSDNWLLSVPVFLAASLWKKHGTKCGLTIQQTYSQGQNNSVSIVSFDDKIFPTQTIWIRNLLTPSQKIKMKYELTSCEGSQSGFLTFCLS